MPLTLKILLLTLLLLTGKNYVMGQNEPIPITVSKEKVIIDGKTYLLHTVKPGETLFSISKAYNTPQKEIIAINPDASSSIKSGQVLKIPTDSIPKLLPSMNSDAYIFHIVEAGQTVFSIAEKYNISKEELFKHNPEVEISPIQTGQVIKIPKNTSPEAKSSVKTTASFTDHKVKKKETLYSISKSYNLSVDDIIAANPELNTSDIKAGQILKIPTDKPTNITAGNVLVSNEMKKDTPVIIKNPEPCDPTSNKKVHEVAFLLPLFLDENKTVVELDSLTSSKSMEEKLIYPRSKNFIEFYEGALIAIDSLKKAGYSFKIHVYDTGRDPHKLSALLNRSELKDMELFIGPFDTLLLDIALPFAKANNIRVVSPLSQNANLLAGYPNLFQVNPSEAVKVDGAIQYLATQKNKNIILFKTSRPADYDIYNMFEEKLIMLRADGYQFKTHTGNKDGALSNKLVTDKENLIVMPSLEETAVSDLLRNLNYINNNYKISVFGLSKWTTFSSTEVSYLHNLQFEYYTSFFADYTKPVSRNFVNKMRDNFKTEPTAQSFSSQGYNFAFLGYDITFYFLGAVAKFGRDFDSCLPAYQVDLTQSDFHFAPVGNGDGTMNKVINIVKYNKDYTITKLH